jgi:predicted ATP-dependent endonuclease of OLD family
MKIEALEIKGYKSIENRHHVQFDDTNIVIGRNNTGKSSILNSILDIIEVFPDKNMGPDWIRRRTSGKTSQQPIHLSAEFKLSDSEHENILSKFESNAFIQSSEKSGFLSDESFSRYRYFRVFDPEGIRDTTAIATNYKDDWVPIVIFEWDGSPLIFDNQEWAPPEGDKRDISDGSTYYLDIDALPDYRYFTKPTSGWSVLNTSLSDALSRWRSTDAFRVPRNKLPVANETELQNDGENLARVLHAIRGEKDKRFEDISKAYSEVMEGVTGIRTTLRGENDTTIVVDEENYDRGFELAEISAGSKEILTLITQIILADYSTDLLLIEEPELHLHPDAEREIYKRINQKLCGENGTQVIVSTHSDVFVDLSELGNIIRVKRENSTTIAAVDDEELEAELADLHNKSGLLLGSEAVVFVEGESDRRILAEVSKKFDHPINDAGIELVDLEGGNRTEDHGRSLVKTVELFDISHRFVIDSDLEDAEEVVDDHVSHINDDADWWFTKHDLFRAWEEDEIESVLLEVPDSVATVADVDVATVSRLNEDREEDDKGSDVMEKIFQEGATGLHDGEDAYRKVNHGVQIIRQMNKEQVPEELYNAVDEILDMVEVDIDD